MIKQYDTYLVYYRHFRGDRRILRNGVHTNFKNYHEKEFRLMLIKDYNEHGKRVEKIQKL